MKCRVCLIGGLPLMYNIGRHLRRLMVNILLATLVECLLSVGQESASRADISLD